MTNGAQPLSATAAPAWAEPAPATIALIMVSYRTPGDVVTCLEAIGRLPEAGHLAVFVCENGGPQAWTLLCAEIAARFGLCRAAPQTVPERFSGIAAFRLQNGLLRVQVGEAQENLGYAGGVNAWMVPMLQSAQWQTFWILNPDALPLPDTLTALIESARRRHLCMVGSRLMTDASGDQVRSMGLRWRRLRAITQAVGYGAAVDTQASPEALDAQIDAPSGCSVLLTRACAEALVPLDERFFLYYEDLEWGVRARSLGCRIGYAHNSVVVHAGGRSLGSAYAGPGASELALYLEHRNRLVFVARYYPGWWIWTVFLSWLRVLRLARREGFGPACRGLVAGMCLETGRPDRLLAQHRAPGEG